ncbi:MAG: hypothetical protein AAF804_05010 [Bacteroidota bacterium]
MKNARVIQHLKELSPGELRRFEVFVTSPYFNQNPKLISLIDWLVKLAPEFHEAGLAKEQLHKVMFGDELPFHAQAVHDQCSQLLRLLERFLGYEHFDEEELATFNHQLAAFSQRPLQEHAGRLVKKVQKSQEDFPYRNGHYYYHCFTTEFIKDTIAGTSNNRQIIGSLPQAAMNLDTFYLATRLRLGCEMINRKNLKNTEYQNHFTEHLLHAIHQSESSLLEVPVIAIYYRIFLALTEPDQPQHYQKLVNLLYEHDRLFPRDEAYSMYAYAQNYCIRRINQGDGQYLQAIFSLYQRMLENELILNQGVLAHEHYKNITTVGLRTRQFEWVKDFLDKYRHRLHPDYRLNAYNYNLAVFHYEQQQYREAMKLLNSVNFTDIFYHLSAKSTLLKIYYDLGDGDSLKYQIQAFRALLKRNQKIPRYHVQTHQNLLRWISKLWQVKKKLTRSFDLEELHPKALKVAEELNQAKGVANLRWLKKKAEELVKKTSGQPDKQAAR